MDHETPEISEVKAHGSSSKIPLKLEFHPPEINEVKTPGYWHQHPLKSLAFFGPPKYSEARWIGYLRIAFSMLFCFAVLGTIFNGFEEAINSTMAVQQSTVRMPAVPAPDIVICPTTYNDFNFTFDCAWIDIKGNVNWFSDTPNHCPHISPITVNGKLPSVGSSHCYIVRPVGFMLDSTNVTNYYLATNFTDIITGKVLDNPAYAAYAFFFDPSSNILLNNDTEVASEENPFLQELIRPVLISPQKKFLFDFSQTEWSYLQNERSWLGKTGFPFVPRHTITTLNFVIQEVSYNTTNYDALSTISVGAEYTKQSNRLVHAATVQSVVSSIGGLFSLVAGLYLILFGAKRMSPWGLAHIIRLGPSPFETKIEKPVETSPEVDRNHFTGGDEHCDEVRQRLYDLESQMVIVRNHFLNMDDLITGKVSGPVRSGTAVALGMPPENSGTSVALGIPPEPSGTAKVPSSLTETTNEK
ncbi:hypothetical protein BC938DRAFT_470609 [Jimgerdemannia flammicorona]|uniref:Uncharacterized protein n=1 Tax=Jimgerdemannia flammicorona TaxID=994334 RepID=A0A433Q9U1_9FUNG|nr:hypothetical protein BC938DRAFT_470609 [Jimgerdemannia flammicorona]